MDKKVLTEPVKIATPASIIALIRFCIAETNCGVLDEIALAIPFINSIIICIPASTTSGTCVEIVSKKVIIKFVAESAILGIFSDKPSINPVIKSTPAETNCGVYSANVSIKLTNVSAIALTILGEYSAIDSRN